MGHYLSFVIAPLVLSRARRSLRSFSLIELLVVLALAAILAVLSVTAFGRILRATTLTASAESIVGAFNLAHQTAVARNTDVQFCFYLLPDFKALPNATPTVYRAYQTFMAINGTTNQLTKVEFLPNLTVIASDSTRTTLINIPSVAPVVIGNASNPTNVVLPVYGSNYRAITFSFSPNGGLEPVPAINNWMATLYMENEPVLPTTALPADFAVVQIDPFNGAVSVYRP